ncbi:aromatic ring-hydroxylating dioxygenase subunit alpha [Streptomyces sp. NPDC056987]|uniref:aromatic ring-hydroxylating oxygenase subunit alpha n=1 Tax=Streptomyces sp. NPDC056987 TaxID=3345988 RepID=UPI00363151D8
MTQTSPKTGLTAAEQQYPLPPSRWDASVYTDPDRYRSELTAVFHHSWFPVHPSGDLPRARDFLTWDRIGQSIVITRLDDGSVRAWHNVCQHRGARLVNGSGNCGRARFTCPWHGFVYDLEGVVGAVPLRESFDEEALRGLRAPAVQVTEWAGWIWLALSDDVPPLLDHLGAIGTELAGYGLEGFTTRFRTSVRLKVNWKIAVDGFNETWHVPFTHPHTLAGLVMWRDAVLRISSPHSWMTLPIRGYTERAKATDDHRASHLCHYLVFPNTIFSCFPTHLQMWSAWPVSVDETELCAYEVVGPPPAGKTAEQWDRHNRRDWQQFLDVLNEDAEVINDISTVIGSLGFRGSMFNTAESRLTAFHREIARRIGEEEPA